ncbi:MAG: trypsin-like peptidase domain-containing protein [Porticoccaceae bacterium]|nr:trypsin-like peptidase domain-containing protein [Porticoccaceae bacterium]
MSFSKRATTIWPVITGLLAAALILTISARIQQPAPEPQTMGSVIGNLAPVRTITKDTVSYSDAVQRAAPAVVNIYTRTLLPQRLHPLMFNDPLFQRYYNKSAQPQQQRMASSLGSGVILSDDGFILTNHHVVAGADEIIVLLYDGREAQAQLVGSDLETDLAVLRITLDKLSPIAIGNSSQTRVGDVVLAIGNPFGLGQSVSQGIISARERNGLGLSTFENFLQTDAAINQGNSGGALIDAYGNLLGINSATLNESSSVGIGFAIPVKTVIKVLEDIVQYGKVIRGSLGIQAQQLSQEIAGRLGLSPPNALIITHVQIGSPAHTAGLQPRDIITHINSRLVSDGAHAANLIADLKPGDPVRLRIVRDNQIIDVTAIAGTRATGSPISTTQGDPAGS